MAISADRRKRTPVIAPSLGIFRRKLSYNTGMRLYDEIFKNADGGAASRCIVVPRGGGYFEGVKALDSFSEERVVVCFSKTLVEVEGSGLSIRKYCDGDLQLDGKILSLRTVEESR